MADKRAQQDVLELAEPLVDVPEDMASARERRMNLRAYRYWESLLRGRDYPSVVDFQPEALEQFRDYSILLQFSGAADEPVLRFIGRALRDEAGLAMHDIASSAVPTRTLVSRLTDHYLEILANRAPIGFEAEFDNHAGEHLLYRGILLPLSDDGQSINFIYGVINWKRAASSQQQSTLELALAASLSQDDGNMPAPLELTEPVPGEPAAPLELTVAVPADEPPLELADALDDASTTDASTTDPSTTDPSAAEVGDPDDILDLDVSLPSDPGPADADDAELLDLTMPQEAAPLSLDAMRRAPVAAMSPVPGIGIDDPVTELANLLATAREQVDAARSSDHRSRASLYAALGDAHAFALAGARNEEALQTLFEDAGITAPPRAPLTPVVKLVFGADYDKTRLTEFAAALSFAAREDIAPVALPDFIDDYPGGLKGIVAAERAHRRRASGNRTVDRLARSQDALRTAPAVTTLSPEALGLDDTQDQEFIVLLARRRPDGSGVDLIASVPHADNVVNAALRRYKPKRRR